MEFGQNATVRKAMDELTRCVRNFGGVRAANAMLHAASLQEVVESSANWLCGKSVLSFAMTVVIPDLALFDWLSARVRIQSDW